MTSPEKPQSLPIDELLASVAQAMPQSAPLEGRPVELDQIKQWNGSGTLKPEVPSVNLAKVAEMGKKTGAWVLATSRTALGAWKTAHAERREAATITQTTPVEPAEPISFFESIFVQESEKKPTNEVKTSPVVDLSGMQLLPAPHTASPRPVRLPSQEIVPSPDVKMRAAELVYAGTQTGEIAASSIVMFPREVADIIRHQAALRGISIKHDRPGSRPTPRIHVPGTSPAPQKAEPVQGEGRTKKKGLGKKISAILAATAIVYVGSNVSMRDVVCKDHSPLAIAACGGGKLGDGVTKNIPVLGQILSVPSILMDSVYKLAGQKER